MVGVLIFFAARMGAAFGEVLCLGGMYFPNMLSSWSVWGVGFGFGIICSVGSLP